MSRTKQYGFSLVETAIAMTIAVALFSMMALALGHFRNDQVQSQMIALQAREMSIIKAAAASHVAANKASWTAGQRVEIPIADLITGGLLPAEFARRPRSTGAETVGTTPFGQPYRVVAIKHLTDGRVRTIITEQLVPLASRLAKAGVAAEGAAIAALKTRVGGVGVTNHKAIAGTVLAGSTAATGFLGTFSNFPLSDWLQSAPAQALTVSFLGFPELGDEGGGNPNDGGPQFTDIEVIDGTMGCPLSSNERYCENTTYTQPDCTDGRELIVEWATCYAPLLTSSPIGTLTSGSIRETSQSTQGTCNNGFGDVEYYPKTNTSDFQTTSLNNVNFYRSRTPCSYSLTTSPSGSQCPTTGGGSWPRSFNAMNKICGRPSN